MRFEAMLALPDEVLVPAADAANATLPYGLVETIRRFDGRWAAGPGPSGDACARIVELGAIPHLRSPDDVPLGRSPALLPARAPSARTRSRPR